MCQAACPLQVFLVALAAYEDAAGWKEDTDNASLSIIVPVSAFSALLASFIMHSIHSSKIDPGDRLPCLGDLQTLNEEAGISACIHRLQALEPAAHQIIVADGGSTDRLLSLRGDVHRAFTLPAHEQLHLHRNLPEIC